MLATINRETTSQHQRSNDAHRTKKVKISMARLKTVLAERHQEAQTQAEQLFEQYRAEGKLPAMLQAKKESRAAKKLSKNSSSSSSPSLTSQQEEAPGVAVFDSQGKY